MRKATQISFSKFSCFLLLFLVFQANLQAQRKVQVYLSTTGKDTISESYTILQTQLNKSLPVQLEQRPQKDFKGDGILLSANPENWRTYSAPLKKLGIEGVVVCKTGNGIAIIGNSQMAVQHGLFIYLEKLGYRFFFPHPDWHIIPAVQQLFPSIKYAGKPSFDHRRIWYGYGTGSASSTSDYFLWFKANRQGGSMNASFGQAYDNIVFRNEKTFKEHPEWFYPKPAKGVIPNDPKFDIANEELVQFVISDVLQRIEKSKREGTGDYKMISLSPSDGPGICNSPACQKFGTLTDRVIYLVNRVAKVVRQKHPGTWIGVYAYSEFITPPTIALEPNVFVGVTTAFNGSKFTIEELVKRWSSKAKMTGMYDYFSNFAWDLDAPGQSLASRPNEAVQRVKKYYQLGVRGYEAESTTGWISKGLGHYLSARLMWDIKLNEAGLREEFFQLSFGKSAGAMKKLWAEWESFGLTTPRQSDLARWFDMVLEADKKETAADVRKRIFHVKSYLYYLALLRKNKESKTEGDLVSLLNYSYRMMDYGSFAGYPALFQLGNLSGFPGMKFNDPKAKWKSNQSPIGMAELDKLFVQERSRVKEITGLKTFSIGTSFIKAPGAEKWKGAAGDGSRADNALWMPHDFVVQIVKSGKNNFIELSGNYVSGGGSDKPIRIDVYKYSTGNTVGLKPLLTYDYKGLKTTDKISLENLPAGLYKVKVDDPVKIFRIKFSAGINYSLLVSQQQRLNSTYSNHLFFYVPAGTTRFSVWKTIEVKFITPTGRLIDLANKKEEETEVEVKPGEEGLWKISFFSGSLYLDGVPSVLGVIPSQMLIPAASK